MYEQLVNLVLRMLIIIQRYLFMFLLYKLMLLVMLVLPSSLFIKY